MFNTHATTEIYTLSLHDALPISRQERRRETEGHRPVPRHHRVLGNWVGSGRVLRKRNCAGHQGPGASKARRCGDRKSTRLNSSHTVISYAVFCLKKKKK